MLKPGGEPIPGYRLEQFLGRGQFGEVWRSTAPGGGKAALKFLDLSGKQGWKEFRGIQSVKKIRHPHLMPITALWLLDHNWKIIDDAAVDRLSSPSAIAETLRVEKTPIRDVPEPRWLVVAQLLGDKTLGDRLKECEGQGLSAIPVDELLRYMEEAAKGIDFLNSAKHDLGKGRVSVQHCDIKPANILLLGDSVLICDYGVAQVLADGDLSTTATGMVGSPAYMAPECIERKPSSCSDQYSLAVTYAELRTGSLPFASESYFEVIDAHRRGKLDLSRLTPAERAVIRKATAVDPQARYPHAQDMVRDLYRAVHGDETPRRWKQVVPLAMTLGIILASIATLIAFNMRTDPQETPHVFQLKVTPAEVNEILVDGKPLSIQTGTASFERKPVGTVDVQFPATDEFDAFQQTVTLSEFLNTPIPIQLRQRPQFLVSQAWQKLADGKTDSAVAFYRQALEKQDDLRRFPSPDALLAVDNNRSVEHMKVSRDGKWLIAATNHTSATGSIHGWQVNGAENETTADALRASHRMRESSTIMALEVGQRWVVSVESDNTETARVVVRSIEDLSEIGQYEVANNVVSLVISADDRWLIFASDLQNEDGSFGLRRVDLQGDLTSEPELLGTHEDVISQVRVRDDGSLITASWADNSVIRWTPKGTPEETSGEWTKEVLATLQDDVNDLLLLPRFIVVGGGDMQDAKRYPLVYFEDLDSTPKFFPEGHNDVIHLIVTDRDQQRIASGSEDGGVHVWRMTEQGPGNLLPLLGGPSGVSALTFLDKSTLVSAAVDGSLAYWDLGAKHRIEDRNKTMHLPVLGTHGNLVKQLVADASGRWLFSASQDGSLRRWDVDRCRVIKRACEAAKLAPLPASP